MTKKKGNLSIHSENLFPIIKKWLYSDHDIFVREMISNSSDAITKLKKLALIGEFNEPADEKYKIIVDTPVCLQLFYILKEFISVIIKLKINY